jgi:hypothetical protein
MDTSRNFVYPVNFFWRYFILLVQKFFCDDTQTESDQTNLILVLILTRSLKVQFKPKPQDEYPFDKYRPPNRNL